MQGSWFNSFPGLASGCSGQSLNSSHHKWGSMGRRENSQRNLGYCGYILHSRDHQNNSQHGIPPAQGGANPNVSREGTFGKAGAPLAPKCSRQESLTHSSYFCREEGPNVLRAAPKMGHGASTRLMKMQELLPTQAAVSQPSSQRSGCFQLTELLPAHFRDHLENRC